MNTQISDMKKERLILWKSRTNFRSDKEVKTLSLEIKNLFPSIPLKYTLDKAADVLFVCWEGNGANQEFYKYSVFLNVSFKFGDYYSVMEYLWVLHNH